MLKDLPKGLVSAVTAINQKSREAFIAEQRVLQEKMAAKQMKMPKASEPKADPAAVSSAKKMAEEAGGSAPRNEKEKKLAAMRPPKDKITHGDVLHGRGVRKEEAEKKPVSAFDWKNMPRQTSDGKTKTGHAMKQTKTGRVYTKEEIVDEGMMDTIKKVGKKVIDTVSHKDDTDLIKDMQKKAGVPVTGKKPVKEQALEEAMRNVSTHKGDGPHHAVVKRDVEWNEYQVHFYKDGKHMGEGPVSHHDDKKDAQDTAEHEVKRMNAKAVKEEVEQLDEIGDTALGNRKLKRYVAKKSQRSINNLPYMSDKEKEDAAKNIYGARKRLGQSLKNVGEGVELNSDTPGNSTHQCAIHVKHSKLGEGKTLFSQHAEPDANGNIAWYDIMFAEGISRVKTSEIEILVSEGHMNHKKKAM